MKPGDQPVFPFTDGETQFLGLSLRALTKIAALHGLLVGGTDLSAEEAADYARRAADALYPQPQRVESTIDVTRLATQIAEIQRKPRWRFW